MKPEVGPTALTAALNSIYPMRPLRLSPEDIDVLPGMPDTSIGYPPGCHARAGFYVLGAGWAARAANRNFIWGITGGISRDGVQWLIERSKGRCELTGLPFVLGKWKKATRNPMAPSIDRINSRRGYLPDNCRVVLLCVNLAMSEWGTEVFDLIARSYVNRDAIVSEMASAHKKRISDERVMARIRQNLLLRRPTPSYPETVND